MISFCHFKDLIEERLIEFAKKELDFDFSFVFYDITTLYFETFKVDDLRKEGFSKDNKIGQPQILIGLIVEKNGFLYLFMFLKATNLKAMLLSQQYYHLKKDTEFLN